MTFSYGPYSSGGGSTLSDAQWGEFAKALLGTGVIKGALIAGSAGNDFAVTAPGSGMTVNVGTGQAMVYGHWCQNDASSAQTIGAADPSNPRIDRVVLKHDVTAKTVSIVVKAGTPAPSPSAPSLTQTPSTWEMSLCQVAVGAGVSSISNGNVTDERTYAVPTGAVSASGDTMTGALTISEALSGANKSYISFVATDGKTYRIQVTTTGAIQIFNATDSATVAVFGPAAGTLWAGPTPSSQVWHAGNDGTGSGLDADTLDGHQPGSGNGLDADTVDGVQAAGLMQFGSGGQKTGFKVTEGNALPASGMTKGDVHFLTPFALP